MVQIHSRHSSPASQTKLIEKKSAIFTEKYDDYLKLGIEEWKKSYAEHQPLGKKAELFVMVIKGGEIYVTEPKTQ